MCPVCKNSKDVVKRGVYYRLSDHKKVQRFQCNICYKSFSTQSHSFDYRLRKRRINQSVFRLLSKGVSQRGCSQILNVHPKTIARRVKRFGVCAKKHVLYNQNKNQKIQDIVFDEMESFEHTKLKPVTIPIAVEKKSRKILAVYVGKIAAKGHLAQLSKKKYGFRKCERKKVLNNLFSHLTKISHPHCSFSSDESSHYPKIVSQYFKFASHQTFKGRKASIVGQGEMKKGGFDPLFSFNQTAAMIRDNVKRLSRRTWCTTKKIKRLLDLLYLYAFYHNQKIDGIKRPRIFNPIISN